ncbi:MAG: DUF1566 domain-containing protein [Methylococcales bacterium]|nr:DUF1566 domain-containing protein [Methylococcales bacterium]
MSAKRFKVALSFPGERRDYVLQVAELLAEELGKAAVFYDDWYKHQLARPNLDTYLMNIYQYESHLLVPFLCADYENKQWCRLEWRAMRELLKQRQDDDIMPLRFDKTHISGLFSIDGYIDLQAHSPKETAELILLRLQDNSKIVEENLKTALPKGIADLKSEIITIDDWQTIDQYRIKDGLAFDTKTDLLWLRFAYGQAWENGTTQGQAVHMDWDTVAAAADDFNDQGGYAGYSDWRLPTIDELESLVNKHKGKEGDYIHPDIFPNNNGAVFWSSISVVNKKNMAWGVDFDDGYTPGNDKSNFNQVRLVRIGQ